MMDQSSRGVTRVDLLVACTCGVLVLATVSILLGQAGPNRLPTGPRHPLSMKNEAQLWMIHKAFAIFAQSNRGRYPIPGFINRKAADLDGDGNGETQLPDVGPEDIALNTTANVYSALVAQQFFTPRLLISPIERNPRVKADDGYNLDAYNPAEDLYWDAGFTADLMQESNTSYAHLVLHGQRKISMWQKKAGGIWPVLSNRGPKDGKPNPKSYTCGPHGNWSGHVVYTDDHIEFHSSPKPKGVSFIVKDHVQQDNLFAFDDGFDGRDTILSFTKQMTEDGPVIQHD